MSRQLTIAEVAQQTGLTPATLRAWETRHGFPRPARVGRHRRYERGDVVAVQRVLAERDAGATLPAAIARAQSLLGAGGESLFAETRRLLEPRVVRKRTMTALSHAIEDECSARAVSGLLVGAFQEQRFYEASRARWRDLARSARRALVFADFAALQVPEDGPVEVPIASGKPLEREWAVIHLAPDCSALLIGRERLAQESRRDRGRQFELIWTAEPAIVRTAATAAVDLVRTSEPALAAELDAELHALRSAARPDGDFVAALVSRMIGYLDRP